MIYGVQTSVIFLIDNRSNHRRFLSGFRSQRGIKTRKLPGRQLYLSDGEGLEGEEEEDEEHTEQYQGCTIRICKMIIPMS